MFPFVSRGLLLAGTFFSLLVGLNSVAYSATYYLSPSGSNVNNLTGSSDRPWQTFTLAIPKLQPGDTLILKDGTYDQSNSGYPKIDCSTSGAKNGTSAKPITIKAQHERRAFLNVDGSKPAFRMENCSYWIIEGLRAKSADNPNNTAQSEVFHVKYSSHLTFKRLLITHNNRYRNSQLLLLWKSNNILVEESEFYSFHRHAISLSTTNNSVVRRNYVNSREHHDVSGGWASTGRTRGQSGAVIYPGSNNIIENNISEGNRSGVSLQSPAPALGNKLLGNISLNDFYGVNVNARGTGSNKMPIDTMIENLVVVNPTYIGVFARGTKNTQVKNISVFGGPSGIVADFDSSYPGDGVYSFFSENVLVMNHSSKGIKTASQNGWSHDYSNAFNNAVDFNSTTNVTNAAFDNPNFGTCKVFVPKNSPLKNSGKDGKDKGAKDGKDKGANVLYRYSNGNLTSIPLWDPKTGEFPGGAIVPGVNDIAGSSRFDVHKRLNVNFNGCSLPENYGRDLTPDLTPQKLRIITSG